ncbi:fascin domain-containing protein [Sphingobacterium chungjuense]|uniref:fascin domain-containing protein n=1 Tax=Sphingobacterium chungjuense TaxID=2675553 RepID=UPI00140C3FFE|nr:hypothetical protein [Sphingobacterium chungjuense]
MNTPPKLKIAFKATNGKYVSTTTSKVLSANSDLIGPSEIFQMIIQEEKYVALLAENGKYVINQQNGELPIAAVSDIIDLAARFKVYDWGKNQAALMASNHKYIEFSLPDAQLQASSSKRTTSASFEIVFLSESGTTIQPIDLLTETPTKNTIQS